MLQNRGPTFNVADCLTPGGRPGKDGALVNGGTYGWNPLRYRGNVGTSGLFLGEAKQYCVLQENPECMQYLTCERSGAQPGPRSR